MIEALVRRHAAVHEHRPEPTTVTRSAHRSAATGPPPEPATADESAALTAAIARGDTDAFARFYEIWFDRTYALTRSISRRDENFCMDATQDVMLRVAERVPQLRDARAVAAWMARTTFTTVADLLRRERRRLRHERRAAEMLPLESAPSLPAEHAERVDWLHDQLARIDARDRLLLLERFGNERTLAELGDGLGTTANAVHGRVRRALLRLRAIARRSDHAE